MYVFFPLHSMGLNAPDYDVEEVSNEALLKALEDLKAQGLDMDEFNEKKEEIESAEKGIWKFDDGRLTLMKNGPDSYTVEF